MAEAQPLTDLQIQQTLLNETAGLTLTAGHTQDLNSELDTEPSSPTRLLRNIERQVRFRHLLWFDYKKFKKILEFVIFRHIYSEQ